MTKSNVGLHTIKVKRMYFDTSSDTNAVFLRPLLNGVNYVGSIFFFYPTEMYSCCILSVLVSLRASFTDRTSSVTRVRSNQNVSNLLTQ